MAKNPKEPRRISLRALAAELGVNHSSLSAAVRDGRLTRGVRLDSGRVVVTDADAATANWEGVHLPHPGVPSRRDLERAELRAARLSEYVSDSASAVLVVLHLIDEKDRDAAIARLRQRFADEAESFVVDKPGRFLACFDRAIAAAVDYLDEDDELGEDVEDEK